ECAGFFYLPMIFLGTYRSGDIFLDDRIQTFGGFFTPLMLVFTVLAWIMLLVLVPSLLEELSPPANAASRGRRREAVAWSERLGRWLDGGLAGLKRLLTVVVPPGAIVGGALYVAFLYREFGFANRTPDAPAQWRDG